MSTIIDQLEAEQLKPNIPSFAPGDTVVVEVRVKEGERERLQAFEGVIIAVRKRGLNSSFTVRKISHGEGVERVFQTHSPMLASIKVKRRGNVRRAKLYYLRGRTGRSARITEKLSGASAAQLNAAADAAAAEAAAVTSDDLTAIEGIGPKVAEALMAAEVMTFGDLADKTPEQVKGILDNAEGNFSAMDTGTWPAQAEMARDERWEELQKWQDELDGGKPAESSGEEE